ncbi:MAG: hypothetical protein R3F37_22535 [Candidatus Competibacteraceae bacterium]
MNTHRTLVALHLSATESANHIRRILMENQSLNPVGNLPWRHA